MFKMYTIDKEYINFLKEFDNRVPDVDYGGNVKLFIGKIYLTNNISLYIPITSYKPKFETMKNTIDFIKIVNPVDDSIAGAIDINNMIPVPDTLATEFTYDTLRDNPAFKTLNDKDSYYQLVLNENRWFNSQENFIKENAEMVYKIVKQKKPRDSYITHRCCDYPKLLIKAIEYNDILKTSLEELTHRITRDYRKINSETPTYYENGHVEFNEKDKSKER